MSPFDRENDTAATAPGPSGPPDPPPPAVPTASDAHVPTAPVHATPADVPTAPVLPTAAALTSAWLAAALGRPDVVVDRVAPIGTGQVGQVHRVAFRDGDGPPESVVLKLAAEDEGSRSTAIALGLYAREVAFYRRLAGRLGASVPRVHAAAHDPGSGAFTLLLEDVADARQGDQVAGCTPARARMALVEIARVHAAVPGDVALGADGWIRTPVAVTQAVLAAALPGFLERFAPRLDPAHADVVRRFAPHCDAWGLDVRGPQGLVHGDFRLDNVLFAGDGCRIVDWQLASWGPPVRDVAYFLGGALDPAVRRAHEEGLLRAYRDEVLRRGGDPGPWAGCWDEYRRQTFLLLLIAVVAAQGLVRTERGDAMLAAIVGRGAQQVLDLGALDLLPRT